MKNRISFFILCVAVATARPAFSQGLLNNGFQQAGNGSAVLSYTHKAYTEFWAGTTRMDAPNDGLNQSIVSLYASYGITDWLEAVAQLPYLSNTSKDGQVSDNSLQDVSLFLKGKLFEQEHFTLGLGLGTYLATGYDPGSLYSLGNGASTFDGMLLLQYRLGQGFGLNGQAGYSLRSSPVPNAALFNGSVTYSHPDFYLEAGYGWQGSADGIAIGGPAFTGAADFPKAKVSYQQLFFSAYSPIYQSLGLTANFGTILDGENIGKYSYISAGLVLNW